MIRLKGKYEHIIPQEINLNDMSEVLEWVEVKGIKKEDINSIEVQFEPDNLIMAVIYHMTDYRLEIKCKDCISKNCRYRNNSWGMCDDFRTE